MKRIISIAKHSLLPSIYVYPYIKRLSAKYPITIKPSSTGEQLAEENVGMGFSYSGCTSAWICSHTTSLLKYHEGRERRELERMAMQLKHHSLSSLRDKILSLPKSTERIDMDLIMHVMWLHTIECMARDWDAAKAHAKALSVVIEALEGSPEMITILIPIQFNDIELCVHKMRRTTMDFEGPFGQRLIKYWQAHNKLIPQQPDNDDALHQCLASSDFLQPICARLRHFLRLSDSPGLIDAPEDPSSGDVIWLWISSMTQYDTGILLNRFLDLTETKNKRRPSLSRSPSSGGLRYTEACMTLTMLHLLRKYFHESPLRGVDFRDASQIIMTRLRTNLKLAIKHSTLADVTYYREAYLWMFFAGAQHEAKSKSDRKLEFEDGDRNNSAKPGSVANAWFGMMLAEQAKALGVPKWDEARKILEQFLYTDYYEPHGEKWYEATVSKYARPRASK